MIFLLLAFLLAGASAVPLQSELIEHFECGPTSNPFWKNTAKLAISHCNDAVRDRTNLCCKEHDLCYDVHAITKNTRQICDARFCNCLQDVSDRLKNGQCYNQLSTFCNLASTGGEEHFQHALPSTLEGKFDGFVDEKPLGLDMQSLLKTCPYSGVVVVHCHNSVYNCLRGDHERIRRLEKLTVRERIKRLAAAEEEEADLRHSYQDCRSTMHHCLQVIVDSAPSQQCTAVVKTMAKQLNIYAELDETKHGAAIIEAYPIPAARLLKQCGKSEVALVHCFSSFQDCAAKNREEHPELFNAQRRIKIVCHRSLSSCLREATTAERIASEDCAEAHLLAIQRIRENDLVSSQSYLEMGRQFVASLADTAVEGVKKGVEALHNGAKKGAKAVVEGVKSGYEEGKKIAGEAWDTVKSWTPWG